MAASNASAASFASTVRDAQKAVPDGRFGSVSDPTEVAPKGLFQRVTDLAAGFIRKTASVTAESISPANVFVPGGSQAARAAASAVQAGSDVVKSGAEGVKQGVSNITTGVLIIASLIALVYLAPLFNLLRRK